MGRGHYTEDDVKASARILTGWRLRPDPRAPRRPPRRAHAVLGARPRRAAGRRHPGDGSGPAGPGRLRRPARPRRRSPGRRRSCRGTGPWGRSGA
ncbi:DUF1800 family protein [Nocardioides sp. zg-DK7169]|nr:DUF1800 family protein [Nocardioides sp. zg-DK7169]